MERQTLKSGPAAYIATAITQNDESSMPVHPVVLYVKKSQSNLVALVATALSSNCRPDVNHFIREKVPIVVFIQLWRLDSVMNPISMLDWIDGKYSVFIFCSFPNYLSNCSLRHNR